LIKDFQTGNKNVLFDDSLSNMLFLTVFPVSYSAEKVLDNYDLTILNELLPDGVIHVYADEEILFARIKNRKRTNTAHLNLTDEQLEESLVHQDEIYKKTFKIFELLNIPALKINTRSKIDANIGCIRTFINGL